MTSHGTQGSRKTLATNRKAFRDYFVEERIEAGLELTGTEVKSLRAGDVNLAGAFARVVDQQAVIFGMHIKPYAFGNQFNHDPERPRRLLLHRREIRMLRVKLEQKGLAVVPLSIYFRRGKAKLELGLCRGKQKADKRQDDKTRTANREMQRAMRRPHRTR